MRKKLSIVNQIDAICQFDIPLLTKWKMATYDQARLERMLRVAKAYKAVYGCVPNAGKHLKRNLPIKSKA